MDFRNSSLESHYILNTIIIPDRDVELHNINSHIKQNLNFNDG